MLMRFPTNEIPDEPELLRLLDKGNALLVREGGLDHALALSAQTDREILFTVPADSGTAVYSLREFRPWGPLPLPEPYYIFCEGNTEALYFQGFQRAMEREPIYREMLTIVPCGSNTTLIVKEAIRYVEKHRLTEGHLWCVFDKDDFPADRFNQAISLCSRWSKEAKGLDLHAAWSNECFEFWFVLHFADYRSNNYREQYVRFLKDRLGGYKKNRPDLFEVMVRQGNPKLAIRYAKRILAESANQLPSQTAPATTVHELVERLVPYLPEETQSRFR